MAVGKHLLAPVFENEDLHYTFYNFHRSKTRERARVALADDRGPGIWILTGEPGAGRSYFLKAFAHQESRLSKSTAVWPLSLDGWDPDHPDLVDFLEHQLDLHGRFQESAGKRLLAAAPAILDTAEKTILSASVLSLLLNLLDPVKKLVELFSEMPKTLVGPTRPLWEILDRLLEENSRDRRLIVHLGDGRQLEPNLSRWLGDILKRRPSVTLAVSCSGEHQLLWALPEVRAEPLRLEFSELDREELRECLDGRFRPSQFPDDRFPEDLVDAIWRSGSTLPGAVTLFVHDWLHRGVLIEDRHGVWTLPSAGLESKSVIDTVGPRLYEPISQILASLPHHSRQVEDFLVDAALCGSMIPAELIFAGTGPY